GEGRAARGEAGEPCREDELPAKPPGRGGLHVEEAQVEPADRVRLRARRLRDRAPDDFVGLAPPVPEREGRGELLVAVELQSVLVDLPVEVDREVRDARDGAVDPDEALLDRLPAPKEHPSGEGEVPVGPGREDGTAVDLDVEREEASRRARGARLYAQPGRVRVRPDDAKARLGRGPRARSDRED